MTADVYHELNGFNSGIQQALLSLEALTRTGSFPEKEVQQFVEFVREVRAATNSYIVNVIESHETDEAGALFRKRRSQETIEDE